MKRLLLEGTEKQIKNLVKLLNSMKEDKPTIKDNYYLENLWTLQDVQDKYKCSDETAFKILDLCLTSPTTIENINEDISFEAEELGLEEI